MTGWAPRQVPFRFQLGDQTLFSVSLPLQMRTMQLGDGVDAVIDSFPPLDLLASGSQGFGVRALPLAAVQTAGHTATGYLCYVQSLYRRYYIDLHSGFDAYKGRFSAKSRSTITRKVNRYARHCGGAVSWKIFKAPADMLEFHRLARAVSSRSYQERLLDAGLPDSQHFVSTMQELARLDLVRAYILYDGDRPVSYLYCPVEAGVLIYAHLGYDPEYLKMSVGTVLQWLALESVFAEGRFRFFDFTEGQSEHKRLFATHDIQCANVFFMRPSLRNKLLVRSHRAFDRLSQLIGIGLERLGMKTKVKRLLRFGAVSGSTGVGSGAHESTVK
ncbi:MAG: GNAT family N-acetyltransferase [Pseudomonadota bacterium]|nr:GNAT family N-acetyltransferase [Pseudomonadota bacterium]